MQRQHLYFVYILASQRHGTLYTDVTNDLVERVHQHREGKADDFTKRYGVYLICSSTLSVMAIFGK